MRAPVYRHLNAKNSMLGLAFPTEWMVLFIAVWAAMAMNEPNAAAVLGVALYAAFRIAGAGKPEGHVQNWLLWHVRQWWTRGRLSAAARGRVPHFPHGPYEYRDVPKHLG